MKSKTCSLLIFFSIIVFGQLGQAKPSCSELMEDKTPLLSEIRPLLSMKPNEAETQENLKRLAKELFLANLAADGETQVKILEIKIDRVEKMADHPMYPYYLVELSAKGTYRKTVQSNGVIISEREAETHIEKSIPMRTNGKVAFMGSTWQFEQMAEKKMRFNAVAVLNEKQVVPFSQDKLVLNTLPDQVILSRSMSENEKQLWSQGEIEKIISEITMFSTRAKVAPKTTFALNYFEFQGVAPMRYSIPKEVLLNLENQGFISVNVYEDAVNTDGKGMPKEAQTSFGLEVEIVIHGLEGRRAILPFMQKPLPASFPQS